MSFTKRLLGLRTEPRNLSFQTVFGADLTTPSSASAAGEDVTELTALQLSAVYGAVRILSGGVSGLPWRVTRGEGVAAEPVQVLPPWVEEPSTILTRKEFLTQVMTSLLLRGNAYVLTYRDERAFVTNMDVLHPDEVEPYLAGGRLWFRVSGQGGFSPQEVLHIRGLMLPGSLVGLDPITYQAQSIGLGLAAQKFGSSFFRNGAMPSAVVEVEDEISEVGVRLLKRGWDEMHRGAGKSNGLAVLTEGAKFKPITVTPDQAQFLATRQFQVPDIARFYGVPPHLLADASGSTSWGSGLAEQGQNYVTHALKDWTDRLDASFTWLARSERPTQRGQKRVFIHLELDHLTRGSFSDRISTYRTGLEAGIWNLDEVRSYEGLPPLPDGKGQEHRVPVNTAPTDAPDTVEEPPPPPTIPTPDLPEEGTNGA